MNTILIIIPLSKMSYFSGFSAPMQWIFTPLLDKYKFITCYSNNPHLDKYIELSQFSIIELNWYTELYEFTKIIQYIKSKKKIPILFGGLFANQFYKQIFEISDVDYFIKGDIELPIRELICKYFTNQLLKNIPNLTTREFDNQITWKFSQNDFYNIQYSLEWFPEYKFKLKNNLLGKRDNYIYAMPLFITGKSGCSCSVKKDDSCKVCFGSTNLVNSLYNRSTIDMQAKHLDFLIKNIQNDNYSTISIYDNTKNFDWNNLDYYNKEVNIEIDGKINVDIIRIIETKFKKINTLFLANGECESSQFKLDENNIVDIIRYIKTKYYADRVKFYHHHFHNNDETLVEQKYPEMFHHGKSWALKYLPAENEQSSFYNTYEEFFNIENFENIYEQSKIGFHNNLKEYINE